MAGYLVANIDVHDPVLFELYRQQVPAVIAAHGGRYIIRGAPLDQIEGAFPKKRLVVLEFTTLEAARRFYDGPEYLPLLKLPLYSCTTDVAFVEGYDGPRVSSSKEEITIPWPARPNACSSPRARRWSR
jgi:uncharacterized protein (DUF1330 family)